MSNIKQRTFTPYESFIIAILTIVQFTIILDFMVLSPLGAILMPTLKISTTQFGMVVSAYAFSAGASGLLAAGFADRFDRKKMLVFFYIGFIFGTLLCALATNYTFLLVARIVTGIFGGVMGSISFAIVTDLFKLEVRGRVMGYLQMAFASSQVLGLPLGFYLATIWGWHVPFFLIVGVSLLVLVVVIAKMKPVNEHIKIKSDRNPFLHLLKTVSKTDYLRAFAAVTLLATGGFMLMPFGSAFSVNNLGLSVKELPIIYMVTGISSMIAAPFIGKMSDVIGKFKVFFGGSIVTMILVVIYCNLEITPLWIVTLISVIMFIGISSRMISSSALISAIPAPADRGAFMGVNSSVQQISGGIATFIAGLIVYEKPDHSLGNYAMLGYVVVGSTIITIIMMYWLNDLVMKKLKSSAPLTVPVPENP
jgi:predicted MFS family arabinose efflux permease